MELKQRQAILYEIWAWTGSQCSCTVVWYVHSGMHELQDELHSLDLSVALWEQCWFLPPICVFVHPSHLMTCRHLTVFVFIHLMTCTFDNVSIHLIWQYLCSSISSPADTSDTMTVFVFIHTVTYYYWLCVCPAISWPADIFDNVFIHLMTCRHIWQRVYPSHDLHTLVTMFVSIHLMTCRLFWQCVHPSHDLQTHLFVSISWPADTFDNVCVHLSHEL